MTRREPAARIRLIEADKSDSATLLRFYQEILVPNFRPDQMFAEDVFMVAQRSEALRTVLSWDDENNLVGGLTGHWYATCRVFLLDYLVVSSEFRGGGGRQCIAEPWTRTMVVGSAHQRRRVRTVLAAVR